MVISKKTSELIKKIIEKHHKYLLITMLGKKNVPPEVLKELEAVGLKPNADHSFLEIAYHHNLLNPHNKDGSPKTLRQMKEQQAGVEMPNGEANHASIEYLNSIFQNLIEKQRAEVMTSISSIIQDENNGYKFDALQNLKRPDHLDAEAKIDSKNKLKARLRDATGDAARDWDRIVSTEMSNAVSLGSTDRIVADNKDKLADEVYVYRIVVNDGALCKYCRAFYMDGDGTPKVYKLSTLLSNGSNFGKKRADWKPVAVATHPNERCSQVIELKPGWKALAGGSQTFIGTEAWAEYIKNKVA